MENEVSYRTITQRGYILSMIDVRTLRSKYRSINEEVTTASLNKLPQKFMINRILIEEFGTDAMIDYHKQCEEWDKMELEGTGGEYWFMSSDEDEKENL